MNTALDLLHPYPFQRLAELKRGIRPPKNRDHIALSIGEPRHAAPGFIMEALAGHMHGASVYPTTHGTPELREAIARWLTRRFSLPEGSVDPARSVIPVNGTREALFAFAQCVIDRDRDPVVLMPNPFYQIYEGAALLAGAQPWYLNTDETVGFRPDFQSVPEATWKRVQLVYLCSPGNPTGAVLEIPELQALIELADRHDFVIAADECYSEIYPDENRPPPGLLQAAAEAGRDDYARCVVFHSLSKRSNVPGLRSGFVAGDPRILKQFLLYRTYHGCAMPVQTQAASEAAWGDESHVIANRTEYRDKFAAVLRELDGCLDVSAPEGAFYLWPRTPVDDTGFARQLYEKQNVTVLPGSYLSRDAGHSNPGRNRVRMALVASRDECVDAARRIRQVVETLGSAEPVR